MKIVIYTDFDGTITSKSGSIVVFEDFYQSLLIGYKKTITQDYKTTPMKNRQQIQSLFEEKFGSFDHTFNYQQEDINLLMSIDAVLFFHTIFKNPDVEINIVTRNRAEYIKALFTYQGFSTEEIDKLRFMESGFKQKDVALDLQSKKEEVSYLYILDDSTTDFDEMMDAAKLIGYTSERVRGYRKNPGEFEWAKYLKDIIELSGIDNSSQYAEIHEQSSDIAIPKVSTNPNSVFAPVTSISESTIEGKQHSLEPYAYKN